MSNICILIPSPDYFEDWNPHGRALETALGFVPEYRHWTNPAALSSFDLILPLIAWGYQRDGEKWFALLDWLQVEQLPVANPVKVLRWNTDKAYLLELQDAGIPVVPTVITNCLNSQALAKAAAQFRCKTLIIKPPISGGADGTFRLNLGDAIPPSVAGHRMIIQPFLPAISSEGEYSLFYFDGVFSHSIIKRPATGDFRVQDYFGGTEAATAPPANAIRLAKAALAAAPARCLYARVDMLRDEQGVMRVMELELIEPSLFFGSAPDKGAAFAAALLSYRA